MDVPENDAGAQLAAPPYPLPQPFLRRLPRRRSPAGGAAERVTRLPQMPAVVRQQEREIAAQGLHRCPVALLELLAAAARAGVVAAHARVRIGDDRGADGRGP